MKLFTPLFTPFVRYLILLVILSPPYQTAWPGDLDPPGEPVSGTSAMFTLEALYNRLETGAQGNKRTGSFSGPSATIGPTGRTLSEIMAKMPVPDNTHGAKPSQVLKDKTFWGLRTDGTWGLAKGTLKTRSPDPADTIHNAGFYPAFDLSASDTDLIPANILTGTTVFGVSGTLVSAAGNAGAADVLSGKTFSNGSASGLTGTIPDNGATVYTPGTADQAVTAGYHNGSGKVAGDADLVAANIKYGTKIFGVTGTFTIGSPPSVDRYVLDVKGGSSGGRVVSDTTLTVSDFTVDAWVNTMDYNGNLMSGSQGASGDPGFRIGWSSSGQVNTIVSDGGTTKTLVTSRVVNDGQWHHMAMTYESAGNGRVRLFLDGTEASLAGTDSSITGFNAVFNLNLGVGSNLDLGLDAMFDTVRVWERVLSPAEITKAMYPGRMIDRTGLALEWQFEEGGGASVSDESGNGITGTITGNAAFSDQSQATTSTSGKLYLRLPGKDPDGVNLVHLVAGTPNLGSVKLSPFKGLLTYEAGTTAGTDQVTYQVSGDGISQVSQVITIDIN